MLKVKKPELYLDTAATAPIRPVIQESMLEFLSVYGNPSSLHRKGMQAEERFEQARGQILRALGQPSGQFIFTGSGTEANNLAILGSARQYGNRGRHAVTTAIEHPAVLEPFRFLEREGWEVTYVKPKPTGDVEAEDIISAIRRDTVIVSMMHVNNETGAILPIHEVGQAIAKLPKTVFHVDGIQAFGKLPFSVKDAHVDFYSVSGHKLGALKGIGGLYIRKGLRPSPIVYGGGQEDGLRSGTQNVAGALTFGMAAEDSLMTEALFRNMQELHETLYNGLIALEGWVVHRPNRASPFILHASLPGMRGEVLVHAFETEGLYVSTGSACSSKSKQSHGSHVLDAMGLSSAEKTGAIRFSLGTFHTKEDVEQALEIVERQTNWVRTML